MKASFLVEGWTGRECFTRRAGLPTARYAPSLCPDGGSVSRREGAFRHVYLEETMTIDSSRMALFGTNNRDSADDTVTCLCRKQLRESPYAALRELECDFRDGVLTLRGVVPTFHTKQVAYAMLLQVNGVYELVPRKYDRCALI